MKKTGSNTQKNTSSYILGKKKLCLIPKKGNVLGLCASLSEEYICCAAHVLHTVSNCPFHCSYCFLQNYLTDTALTVITDIPAVMEEVKQLTRTEPTRLFRIGTWELGDSLALEPLTNQAKELLPFFKDIPNAILDLRTKSDAIDSLLRLDHGGKTILSWTLNTEYIIKTEEIGTASLSQRLAAITKATHAGYPVSIHFDPMIHYKNWEPDYKKLVGQLFQAISPKSIAWISVGSLRFNLEMKKKIEKNYPKSRITAEEMITGNDNKMRYPKPTRLKMYRTLVTEIKKQTQKEPVFLHLCMERRDVWEKVFGECPASIDNLDRLFTESLRKRYPHLRMPGVCKNM